MKLALSLDALKVDTIGSLNSGDVQPMNLTYDCNPSGANYGVCLSFTCGVRSVLPQDYGCVPTYHGGCDPF